MRIFSDSLWRPESREGAQRSEGAGRGEGGFRGGARVARTMIEAKPSAPSQPGADFDISPTSVLWRMAGTRRTVQRLKKVRDGHHEQHVQVYSTSETLDLD